MNQTKILKYFLFVLLLFAIDCGKSQVQEISVDELSNQMETNDSLIIIDVRTDAELVGPLGKIDSVIHIPIDELEKRIQELDNFREFKIAVICRTGRRSEKGTILLNEYGFDAKNVVGGMIKFREKGY